MKAHEGLNIVVGRDDAAKGDVLRRPAHRRSPLLVVLAVALACTSLGLVSASAQPTPTQTTAPSGPALLPVASARAAALAFWPRWQAALTTANEPAIRSLSVPGPTQESWVLGCGYKNYVLHGTPCKDGPLLGLRVIVPLELRYPVYFMAQFETTTDVTYYASSEVSAPGKYLDIAVLTKQSSASPWRLALDTGYSNSNIKAAPPFIAFSPDSMGLDGSPWCPLARSRDPACATLGALLAILQRQRRAATQYPAGKWKYRRCIPGLSLSSEDPSRGGIERPPSQRLLGTRPGGWLVDLWD